MTMPRAALVVPIAAIAAYLAAHGWTWHDVERKRTPLTIEEIQTEILREDPVVWAEAMLVNKPEQGGGLWRLFDYQKPSMRFRGDVVHKDAAGVGKTREIVALLLWGSTMHAGGSLVAGAEDGNLDEMWDEIQWQIASNPWLRAQVDEAMTKVKPYKKLGFKNGNIARFRPAGHDGRAFRAIHVNRFGFFDEGAVPDEEVVFSEFFRALELGCEARLYSVPDGRTGTPFFRRGHTAIPFAALTPERAAAMRSSTGERRFVKFNWAKTMMPEPFWSAARDAEFIERFGGRDAPGYLRNVLGLDGDPENTVFPWASFSPAIRFVPEYRVAKFLVIPDTGRIMVEAHELNPGYELRSRAQEDASEDSSGPGQLREVYRNEFDAHNFDIAAVLRRIFGTPQPGLHRVGGADVGRSSDEPSEIGISELRGRGARWTARVQLKRMSYDLQAAALRALDEIFNPDHGWGLDATGVGKVLEDSLRGGKEGLRWEDRLTGFVFNSKTVARNPESGDELIDPATGNPRRVTYKELATQLLEVAMQRGQFECPWDPDYQRDFPAHTATTDKQGERGFSPNHDHVIDEKRVEVLRAFELEHGNLARVPLEFAVPRNSARDQTISQAYS